MIFHQIRFEKNFPTKGLILEENFKVKIDPKNMRIKDGKALLRILAYDFSWRQWFKGNKTYLEKDIIIDTKPPEIDIIDYISYKKTAMQSNKKKIYNWG